MKISIIVIGLGSMGRRRIRLLKQLNKNFIIGGVDSKEDRRKTAEEEFSTRTFANLEDALTEMHPECAIVSTSPLSHADIIETCLQHECNVFTELNLVSDKYESNIKLAKEKGKALFLSSTFLYRDEINYIRDKVKQTACDLNYIYHVGQYLPDWHPWEAIQDYFVGDKRTNGCRELFAIELPWITKTFGEIESFEVISGKNTKLPIQYNDNYMLLIKHANGNKGFLAVDVVSRKPGRNLEVYGEDLHITWDGTPAGLKEYDCVQKVEKSIDLYQSIDKQDNYAAFIIENAYTNELKTFLNLVNSAENTEDNVETTAEYTFEDDLKILALIDQIESEQ